MRIQRDKEAIPQKPVSRHHSSAGFTLVEVTMSLVIVGLVFGGILTAYMQAGKRAEWSGYSLAAQAYGIQQLEQARAATWDISAAVPVNEITNLNLIGWTNVGNVWRGYSWTNIDIPYSGGNFIRATNYVTVTNMPISTAPPVAVHMVQVDTVWRYQNKNVTNRLVNYYGPDQ
jgi:prepilin-type N-terminal cleavage/methylation domain-containing protein